MMKSPTMMDDPTGTSLAATSSVDVLPHAAARMPANVVAVPTRNSRREQLGVECVVDMCLSLAQDFWLSLHHSADKSDSHYPN